MMKNTLSRRKVLAGAGAMAVAGPVGLGNSAHADTIYDVIVVGAGPAGISAARTVKSYGRSALILEAMDRVGGRTYSDNSFPAPFDTGAQFFGDAVSGNNILYEFGKAFGLKTISANTIPLGFLNGDKASFSATYAALLSALLAQGELIRNGVLPDMSLANALGDLSHLPYFKAASTALLVQDAADVDTGSTLDYYNFAAHSPAPFVYPANDTFFVPSGFGNLIKRLSGGLQYVLNAPVTNIDTSANPVVITATGNRTYKARKVIVTASTGVLAASPAVITFNPVLPARYVDAIKALPLGQCIKAALSFKTNIFAGRMGVVGNQMTNLIDIVQYPALSVFVNNFNAPMALFAAEEALATALENKSKAAQTKFFLDLLETYFPGANSQFTGQILASNWGKNPYTRGATSYATTGNVPARRLLARPLGRKLWFAGEALSISDHSQAQGAWVSGEAAALGALAALGAAVRPPAISAP